MDQINYVLEKLEQLLNTPSPTGNSEQAIALVETWFQDLGLETKRTNKGALIASLEGKEKEAITFSGHVDTLGAMVKEISSNGHLVFHRLGGYPFNAVEGEYVEVETQDGKKIPGTILLNKASVHVHSSDVGTQERNASTMSIRLDEKVENAEDVKALGIQVGDFVFLDPRAVLFDNGFIKSRHLDDKAGVACILGLAKAMVDQEIKPLKTVHFYISNYEECGHGASNIPENTVDFIAVDMAAPGEGQTSSEFAVTICALDSSGPYDLNLRKKMVELAKDHQLNYVIDIYPFYGSDGSAALRAGHDIRVGLIGPGVSASHSYERTHREALENTIRLMIELVKNQ